MKKIITNLVNFVPNSAGSFPKAWTTGAIFPDFLPHVLHQLIGWCDVISAALGLAVSSGGQCCGVDRR